MSPAKIAAARSLVRVVDDSDAPGTLSSHLLKLEKIWRAENSTDTEQARVRRLTNAELASFGFDLDNPLDTSSCERCDEHWSRCTCGSP